jgi:osmotically-inducible protein OsmY
MAPSLEGAFAMNSHPPSAVGRQAHEDNFLQSASGLRSRRLLALSIVFIALQACAPMLGSDRRTDAVSAEDDEINAHVSRKIEERYGENVRVGVTTFNHDVLLTGQVASEEIKSQIETMAREEPTVHAVQNELSVAGTESFVSRSNDLLLAAKVKSRLANNERIAANNIRAVIENGTVYLMGLVTRAEGEEAAQTAASTSGVQKVIKVFQYLD